MQFRHRYGMIAPSGGFLTADRENGEREILMFHKMGALLLACALLVTMSACSGGSGSSIRGNVTPAQTTAPETTVPETTVPETTEPAFSVGTSSGNRYENTFLGIGCTLDENWTFLTDEQIRENNSAAADMMAEEYQELVSEASVVYDMMANHSNEVDTVSLNMEKLTGAALLIGEEQYAQLSLEGLEGSLTSMGVENIQTKVEQISFAGGTHTCIRLVGEFSGIKVYEALVCYKRGGYMALACACTWLEDGTQAILDCFYAL